MASKKNKKKKKKPIQKKVSDLSNMKEASISGLISHVTRLAEDGEPSSQALLGDTFQKGKHCEKDLEKAIFWYKKAIAQDSEPAKKNLRSLYSFDLIQERGFDATVAYLEEQSEQGDVYANYALASIYFEGEHPNGEKALAYAQKGIEQNDSECFALLGKAYFEGIQLKRNYSEAVRLWRKGADDANISCLYFLGTAYFHGKGVSRNYSTAVDFFSRAAQNKHKDAIRALANCYLEGKGTGTPDPIKANELLAALDKGELDVLSEMANDTGILKSFVKLFPLLAKSSDKVFKEYDPEKIYQCASVVLKEANHKPDQEILGLNMLIVAAQRGYAPAMFSLSTIYSLGFSSISQNTTQALYWCKRAAEAGYPKAQLEYANYFSQGIVVSLDMNKAFHWWLKAAEGGMEECMMHVSQSYFSGQGTEQNPEEGIAWAKKAAEHNIMPAFIMLGRKFLLGEDKVQQDFDEALAWFTKAKAKIEEEEELFDTQNLAIVPQEGIQATQFGALYLDLHNPKKKKALQKLIDFTEESKFSAAQFFLGQLYDKGKFVKKDTQRALSYFTLAANQGFPEAAFYLALYKLKGINGTESKGSAMSLLRKAAEAESILAARYLNDGDSCDLNLELVDLIKAALFLRLNTPENMLKRGYDYFSGIHGVLQNPQKTLALWFEAAEQGVVEAQNNLALIASTDSIFMSRNMELAVHWWKRASCEGNIEATEALAELYKHGEGVEQSSIQAKILQIRASQLREQGPRAQRYAKIVMR